MSKIYTKKGDKGETGTFHGRMAKFDALPEAIGSIDELNSLIGVCRISTSPLPLSTIVERELVRIQNNLLTIGSQLAGSKKRLRPSEVTRLEKLIDKLTDEMPKLSNFIYPVGELQLARAVCRRAERRVVALENTDKNILKYLNRLSDALFTMGRWVNWKMGMKEEVWK